MKKIRSSELRFQGFKTFVAYSFREGDRINDSKAVDKYLASSRDAIDVALKSDTHLYGHRTESMFEALVASLGEVLLLKQEDGSECYAQNESLQIPDFRIVLKDHRQLLVEVKNFHQTNGTEDFTLTAKYLDGLTEYAALTKSELMIAVYWSRWRMWSLNSPDDFSDHEKSRAIAFGKAMMRSHMLLIGDRSVGTKTPLRFVLLVKEKCQEPTPDGNTRKIKIEKVCFFCGENEITDPVERRIAWYLMLYGKWNVSDAPHIDEDGKLFAIEHRFSPEQETPRQGFELVGAFSSMFSQRYLHATSDNDGEGKAVVQLHAQNEPGELGDLIPKGYKGKALPLWIVHQQPSSAA